MADTVIITGEKTVTVVTVGVQGPAGVSGSSVPATTSTIGGIIVGDNLTITGNGVLSAQPVGVTAFNNRTGNITLLSTDVQPITDPLYLQVYKDTQTTQSALTQFGLSSFIQSAQMIAGFSRGLLTANTSGTTTRSIFDGNVYYNSANATYPAYKRIAFNSNQTGGTNATGRLQLNTYGGITGDSQATTSSFTRTVTFGVNSQTGVSLSGDITPAGAGANLYSGKLTSNGTNSGTESGSVFCGDLQNGVTIQGGTIGSPYTTALNSTNTWPVANSNAPFPYTPNYRTWLTLGDTAELIFLQYSTQTVRTPTFTDNSILTQGYADTRYQSVGAYLTSANLTYANLTGTPTTLAGYGITDGLTASNLTPYLTIANANSTYSVLGHTHSIANVTGLQTALDAKLESANFTYSNLTGKPSTFAPSAHTHAISEVTGLQTALDAKLPSANFTYANITGKPTLATVATSGSYTDLSNTPASYSLPTASTTVLGGVKVDGSTITISSGVISASSSYSLPVASASVLGGVKLGTGVSVDANGFLTVSTAYAGTGANSFTGSQNLQDNELIRAKIRDYSETISSPTISAGTLTLNLETSNIFTVALNAAITTLTISNPPASGSGGSFTLILTADGTARAVTWPASIKWAGGTAPTITSTSGKVDSFAFFTSDGGTNWQGYVGGQNF